MGSTTDKASGIANQAAGKVKEAAGKATGSEKLEAEGLAQRAKGKGEKLAGDANRRLRMQPTRLPMPRTKNSELSWNDFELVLGEGDQSCRSELSCSSS